MEQEIRELRSLLNRSQMALVKLTTEVELNKMADAQFNNYRKMTPHRRHRRTVIKCRLKH